MSEDYEEDDQLDNDELEEEGSAIVTIEVKELSLYTHHGVTDSEQELGQRIEVDIQLELDRCDAILTDRVEDTVDYGDVCQVVAFIAHGRSYRTLEALASAIADRLLEYPGADSVWVRVAKPQPPIALPVKEVAVEVWKDR